MRKHSFSFLVIMLATGVFASTAPAQGIFSGIVLDHEANEFEGATITMESTSSARSSSGARHEVPSDAGGRFVMIGLASGQWTITIEAEGFQPQSSTTTIRQGPNSPMNIYLERILHHELPCPGCEGDPRYVRVRGRPDDHGACGHSNTEDC